MATHINTTNAIKGLACVTVHLKSLEVSFIYPALARHSIQHLTSAGLEIERLNNETNKLQGEIDRLKTVSTSSFASLWEKIIDAVSATAAGEFVSAPGVFDCALETERAIAAINKTEADRRKALRTAEAFQEAASHSQTVITHQLKILPEYFQAVIDGRKKAELRTNDRDFKVGDYLLLVEWDGGTDKYTGRKIGVEISDITQCDFAAPKLVLLSFFDPCDEIPF
ncbi:DUF3850 domain-containing protein [Yersinia enterocolitica]|uniref:DUF3850 domain-containing protein n=1 Tax=Yersinia vastinensis TaxID=2890318 RepID=UPI0011A0CA02|nr:DUF3850 domain-containing protein [Yersinia vastinensis]